MKKFFKFIKKNSGILLAIIIVLIIILPYIGLLIVLRKQRKTIQLRPKFKIVDINNEQVDKGIIEVLPDAISAGNSIINKFKGN
jgi:hypothetical protein